MEQAMTISELVIQSPLRRSSPPESIFQAQDEDGKQHLFCMASFGHQLEVDELCKMMPGFLNWQVTRQHMTQEEIDEFVKHRDAKS